MLWKQAFLTCRQQLCACQHPPDQPSRPCDPERSRPARSELVPPNTSFSTATPPARHHGRRPAEPDQQPTLPAPGIGSTRPESAKSGNTVQRPIEVPFFRYSRVRGLTGARRHDYVVPEQIWSLHELACGGSMEGRKAAEGPAVLGSSLERTRAGRERRVTISKRSRPRCSLRLRLWK